MSRDTHKKLFKCEQDNKADTSTNSCPTNKLYYDPAGLGWGHVLPCPRGYAIANPPRKRALFEGDIYNILGHASDMRLQKLVITTTTGDSES